VSEGDLEIVFEYVNTLSPRVETTSDSSRRVEVFEPGKSIDDLALIAQKSGVSVDDFLSRHFPRSIAIFSRLKLVPPLKERLARRAARTLYPVCISQIVPCIKTTSRP
jgi:hypothetical protein